MKLFFLLLVLTSCVTTVEHGVIIKERDLSAIMPNITRKEDVRTLLGEPSFEWKAKWYFISTKKSYRAFLAPKIEKHSVYVFAFVDDVVINIEKYTHDDIKTEPLMLEDIQFGKPDLHKIFI